MKDLITISTDAIAIGSAFFGGENTLPILLDDVECNGNETRLIDCTHAGTNIHNCLHSEDAGVKCRAATLPPPGKCRISASEDSSKQ